MGPSTTEREDGMGEVERLCTSTSPSDGLYLCPQRGRGKQEKDKDKEKKERKEGKENLGRERRKNFGMRWKRVSLHERETKKEIRR